MSSTSTVTLGWKLSSMRCLLERPRWTAQPSLPVRDATFTWPLTGLGNGAAFLCGLDWRGVGGYVRAPRSIHPTGAAYRWLLGEDDPDFGARTDSTGAGWSLGLLRKPKVVPRIPLPRDRKSSPSGVYGRKALESEVGRVVLAPVGQRNDALEPRGLRCRPARGVWCARL